MAVYKHKLTPDFSEGVDRKLLKRIRDRFLKVNSERLARTHQGLSFRHQDIVEVLPLLYQVNHPLMPGYVAREAPVGVSGYAPDKAALSIAKSFSQTFKFKHDRRHTAQIHALYMMGSTGTLAHSESSDVDLWLCFDPTLNSEQSELLARKAARIDAWANGLGLELHTFLMNADQFRAEKTVPAMDAESSGSAQHFLLLDEFYRTAILLAGRYPLWWLIPPHLEGDYRDIADQLLSKRFVKKTEILDFGSAADIPKSELIGAGLWQLYKGLDAPYKSVLKLLLAEVYAQELPDKSSLSQTFKQAVYDDELCIENLDPYLLIYRRLECYLKERGEHKRLDLVRKSFYLKVAKKLSRRPSGKSASWQRLTLEAVTKDWAWPGSMFKYLDERHTWKVDQVLPERQEVVAELRFCYRFLSNFARANNIASSITAEDLHLLGRKLYANFERKAGKVERLNPGIAPSLWEENLAIHHSSSQPVQSDQNCWLLYRDLAAASDASFQVSLKKTSSLIELLAWLYFNGIISHATRLSLVPGLAKETLFEVQSIIHALEQAIPMPLAAVSQQSFQQRARIEKLILFINVGIDPMASMAERGMHRLSNWTDSLGYSSQRDNLVKTIDQIALNAWNEMTAHRYEKGETLLQNLQSYLQVCHDQLPEPDCRLSVHCFNSQRAEAIASRVRELFADAKNAFFAHHMVQSVRYVIEVEEKFYVLLRVDEQFRFIAFATEALLLTYLAQGLSEYCPIVLDRYALKQQTLLRHVLASAQTRCIQVFYTVEGQELQVIVLDEAGSLLRFSTPREDETLFQSSIQQFLYSVLEKRQLSESMDGLDLQPSLEIYKLSHLKAGTYQSKKIKNIPHIALHEVEVVCYFDGLDVRFDVSFDHQNFSYLEYGDQQFAALTHYVKSCPAYAARLPIKITNITLPENPMNIRSRQEGGHSTHEYLRVYQQIMSRLIQTLE